MPLIEAYYQRHTPDLKVLAINYDEPPGAVQLYVEELGLTFDILLDEGGKVSELYRVRAFPSTFFVDEQGVIRYLHLGELQEKQLAGYLEQIGVNQ
jgi:peroxiredoxin